MKRTSSMVFVNSIEAQELDLYIENDSTLYKQAQYIIASLAKKVKKGIYDADKAVDAWYYLATEGAKRYAKEFGSADYSFSVQDRFSTAVMLEENYREQVMAS